MPRVSLPILLLGAFAVWLSAALALSQVQQALLGVNEIHPGMKGYGLTVFRGETPERFDVEVIDVLHKFRPDQDLILIRTPHPILDRAITVAGMSGSPIYLNDKLIGAYAYGWTFGKEPIAGVTPIANMMAEIDRPIDPNIWKALGSFPELIAPLRAARPNASARAFADLRNHAARFGNEDAETRYGRPLPAATPLLLSGMGDRAIDLLSHEFEPFGLVPVQAGGGAGAAPKKTPSGERFVDGGSIGVQLVRGDVNALAVGTVTHVAGRRLVAFGHPMLNAGQVGLATCTTRVIHILSSEMRSFKLAEAIAPLGTLIHDRQSAIVIDQDLKADMLPVRVRIHGVPAAPRTEWNMEVASNRLLTSGLVLAAIVNALEASAVDRSDAVLEVESKVAIDHHGEQITKDVGYSPVGAADGGVLAR
ncbi:MAG TPA: SpoIVB peptidase S55 domain-containing protein, partial [Polyangiales bacterium]|nr:SpoIVB peptidase S55 domain-containing protein [Polyangiales bacterium]